MGQEFESEKTALEDILRKINYTLSYDAVFNLIQVVETDVLTSTVRTSVLSYDAAGNLVSVVQS